MEAYNFWRCIKIDKIGYKAENTNYFMELRHLPATSFSSEISGRLIKTVRTMVKAFSFPRVMLGQGSDCYVYTGADLGNICRVGPVSPLLLKVLNNKFISSY